MSAIKEKVDTFILEVENIAFGELIHKDDVKRLLEIIFETKKEKILFELSFAAKYNTGILRIIRNGAKEAEDEYFSRIKKEYSENLTKLKVYLEDILSGTTDYYKNYSIYGDNFQIETFIMKSYLENFHNLYHPKKKLWLD